MEKTILNTIPYKNTDRIGVIYKITNTITNNFYIGSSITPRKRLIRHINDLIKGCHSNTYIQRSFNKHGINNFQISIIEENINQNTLIQREQFYIDSLKPKYNLSPTAGSNYGHKWTKESKEQFSTKLKGKVFSKKTIEKFKESAWLKNKTGKDNPFSKIVYQYDLNGKLISTHIGIRELARKNNYSLTCLLRACNGKYSFYKNYIWVYNIKELEERLIRSKKNMKYRKNVTQ